VIYGKIYKKSLRELWVGKDSWSPYIVSTYTFLRGLFLCFPENSLIFFSIFS